VNDLCECALQFSGQGDGSQEEWVEKIALYLKSWLLAG
jgi:hypothetical protein